MHWHAAVCIGLAERMRLRLRVMHVLILLVERRSVPGRRVVRGLRVVHVRLVAALHWKVACCNLLEG